MPRNQNLKAFSLVELLLALVLSAVVFALLLQFYLSSQKFARTADQIIQAQENLRAISVILNHHLSMAGYAGCMGLKNLELHNHTTFDFTPYNRVHGFTKSSAPTYLKGKMLAGTEALVIQHSGEDGTILLGDVSVGADNFRVKSNPATRDNKILLIDDCVNADLFTAASEIGNRISLKDGLLAHAYVAHALTTEISRFSELAYFIGANEEEGSSLYVILNQSGDKQELISDITDMQIIYGVDENDRGKVTAYYTTQQMQESRWAQVIAVAITLKYKNKAWKIYVALPKVA